MKKLKPANFERNKKMKKTQVPERCSNCEFLKRLRSREYICDYINKKSQPRNCPIDNNCNKFQTKLNNLQKL